MERSIFAAIFGGFLGILALGGLAFPPYGPEFDSNPQPFAGHTSTPSLLPKPEGDWRILDPVTYENISVFPVVAPYVQEDGAFLTLEEGLATGEVLIRESGSEDMVRCSDGRTDWILHLQVATEKV